MLEFYQRGFTVLLLKNTCAETVLGCFRFVFFQICVIGKSHWNIHCQND